MIRFLILIYLMLLVVTPAVIQAQEDICPQLLKSEKDLDKVYDLSKLVFIARISPRNAINPHIFDFKRYDPVLKGDVPEQGFLTFADRCMPQVNDSIYLFMLNRLDEKIEGFNAIFFALPDGGPGFTWIADWIESKIPRQATTDQ